MVTSRSSNIARMAHRPHVFLFALSFAFLLGSASAQQELKVRGPFVANEAGVTFPEQVGEFRRVTVIMYSPDRKNLGVGYNLFDPENPVVATVYVYPARRVLSFGSPRDVVEGAHDKLEQMEMDSIIHEISNAHRGAQLVVQEKASVTAGGRTLDGRHAQFSYEEAFAGKRQPLLGDVWLFTVGKWYLKYRVTYPAANGERARSGTKKLMSALDVPKA
jgi:hypothetical protein